MVDSLEPDVQLLEDSSSIEDILRDSSPDFVDGVYGDWEMVGHRNATNEHCGTFKSLWGCLRVENHDIIARDGKNHKGEGYAKKVFCSCGKLTCKICYKNACGREAHKIEVRLAEASKKWGEVYHLSATFPLKYWHLPYETLRAMAIKILLARSVIGGVLIWHGARWDDVRKVWYWSPHFHVLGFILGGYGKCRGCPKCHKGCGGWVDRQYRAFDKDGCIVRMFAKRKKSFYSDEPNIGGTAAYQLNHATVKKGSVRFHVATWFGVCSYRKLKVTVERRKSLCPICELPLYKIRYNGNFFVMDENLRSSKRDFYFQVFDEHGHRLYVEDAG